MFRAARFFFTVLAISMVTSCNDGLSELPVTELPEGMEILAEGFTIPWAIEVIGENEFLVSERLGDVLHYQNGTLTPLNNLPRVVTVSDRYLTYGGMMDVSLHPQFSVNHLVYIAYVGTDYQMKVARFELIDDDVRNVEVIFETDAFSIGSRIAWQDDEHFFVSQGSGGNPYPEPGGQDLNSDVGKIHRLTEEGQIPEDNPMLNGRSTPGSIWSYGHRDPQGLYYDRGNDVLYSNEHGPLGGDELNIIIKGENYGWPIFSHGLNYDGTPVSDLTEEDAGNLSQLPIKHWTPSIAPSCLMQLLSDNFQEYKGTFLMGSLSQESIIQYDINTSSSKTLWDGIGRVRDIAELPGGDLVVLIDKNSPTEGTDGRIVKLTKL